MSFLFLNTQCFPKVEKKCSTKQGAPSRKAQRCPGCGKKLKQKENRKTKDKKPYPMTHKTSRAGLNLACKLQ
uniref:Uncharacterized protein n=1 Tax=Anguilla anguilla TaxID=7936 RepID=A0A0E9PZ33_ANGAN